MTHVLQHNYLSFEQLDIALQTLIETGLTAQQALAQIETAAQANLQPAPNAPVSEVTESIFDLLRESFLPVAFPPTTPTTPTTTPENDESSEPVVEQPSTEQNDMTPQNPNDLNELLGSIIQ
jgi:hypothetical protein